MDSVFDFSQESDLKERLWEKMQAVTKKAASAKTEISFDALGGGSKKAPAAPAAQPHEPKAKTNKGISKK